MHKSGLHLYVLESAHIKIKGILYLYESRGKKDCQNT